MADEIIKDRRPNKELERADQCATDFVTNFLRHVQIGVVYGSPTTKLSHHLFVGGIRPIPRRAVTTVFQKF